MSAIKENSDSESVSVGDDDQTMKESRSMDLFNVSGVGPTKEENKTAKLQVKNSSDANKSKLKKQFTNLRIDQIPDAGDEEEDDLFLSQVAFEKTKSPQNITEHLTS